MDAATDAATETVPEAGDGDPIDVLVRALARAARGLGDAGRPLEASRLAAEGWAALRHTHPGKAERLTGVLHYLARDPGTASADPSGAETAGTEPILEDRLLDVRTEIPARRHELIFETYGALAAGESFVLVNDHDPKPLYYQFAAEHAGEFTWTPVEEGPETWQVRIGRTERRTDTA